MAERKAKPAWVRGYHPADTERNFNAVADMVEVLLPDYPVISQDLPATIEVETGEAHTFDLTVADAARGTLTYQWQKAATPAGTFSDVNGATSVDYSVATWDDTTHKGAYRCKITNTLNNTTATVYSNVCVASTAEAE